MGGKSAGYSSRFAYCCIICTQALVRCIGISLMDQLPLRWALCGVECAAQPQHRRLSQRSGASAGSLTRPERREHREHREHKEDQSNQEAPHLPQAPPSAVQRTAQYRSAEAGSVVGRSLARFPLPIPSPTILNDPVPLLIPDIDLSLSSTISITSPHSLHLLVPCFPKPPAGLIRGTATPPP
jgi:hypothetical protein